MDNNDNFYKDIITENKKELSKKDKFKQDYRTPLIIIIVLTIIFIILLLISIIFTKNYVILTNFNDNSELDMESTYTLNAYITPETNKYIINGFISSDPNIIKINDYGIMEALKDGECTITINTNKKNLSKILNFKVIDKNIYPESIELSKKIYNLRIGQTDTLDYTIYPVNSTKTDVKITNNSDIVEIQDKTIKAIKEGNTDIIISTINNKEVTASIIVSNKAQTINVNKSKIEIKVGNTDTINATVLPEDSLRKDLTYTIKDTNIATISNNTIKGIKKGQTTLTISNGEISNTVEIIVKENLLVTLKEYNLLKNKLNTLNKKSLNETDTSYLLFGSDYQDASSKLPKLLEFVKSKSINPNLVSILGDYQASNVGNHTNQIKEADAKIKDKFPNTSTLYIQGNHDNDDTNYIQPTGAYISNNYILYVINTKDNPRQTSSCSSSSKFMKAANKLDEFLKKLDELDIKEPIIILTHVPLHDSSRDDNSCGYNVGEIINKYKNLNIFFMYGHNHSSKYDDCIGGSMNYFSKGSNIKLSKNGTGTTLKLNFYYLNAGYVGLIRNTNGQVSCSGTKITSSNENSMTLYTIKEGHIKIERYTNTKIIKVLDIDLK